MFCVHRQSVSQTASGEYEGADFWEKNAVLLTQVCSHCGEHS